MGYYKNPASHQPANYDDPVTASEVILFVTTYDALFAHLHERPASRSATASYEGPHTAPMDYSDKRDRRATAPAHIAAGPRMAMSPRLGLCRRR